MTLIVWVLQQSSGRPVEDGVIVGVTDNVGV
jgi:hypothetical protein